MSSIAASKENPLNSISRSKEKNTISSTNLKNSQTFETNLQLEKNDPLEIQTAQQVIEKFKDSLDEDAQKINEWADD